MLWQTARFTLDLTDRAAVMGILNLTPDSFSDGGRFMDPGTATEHALTMLAEGAAVIDLGGESTRPGAEPVGVEEEMRRVLPVVASLAARAPGCLLSIDTMKAAVADAALSAGAVIVNDVSAGRGDPGMFEVVRRHGAGFVLMHMQGEPRTMQRAPSYGESGGVVREVGASLAERRTAARAAGIADTALVFDPGIGFGKTAAHNLTLLRQLPEVSAAVPGRPLLVGASRKSFLARALGHDDPTAVHPATERDAATVAVSALARAAGARVLRVHRVRENLDAVRIAEAMLAADWSGG